MNKVIKAGMLFNEENAPDFGSIEKNPKNDIFYLCACDIPKLNSVLTKENIESFLPQNETFDICTGSMAFAVNHHEENSGKIYTYHSGTDHWYESNINSNMNLSNLMTGRHAETIKNTHEINGILPLSLRSNGRPLKNFIIFGNTQDINGELESVGNEVTDTQSEHYGEYCIPITINQQTTNIYLSEPLRKIRNYADSLDIKNRTLNRVTEIITISSPDNFMLESEHNFYLNVPINNASLQTVISNRVQSTVTGVAQSQELSENIWISGSGKINIWLSGIDHTIEAFRQWLAVKPLVIIYHKNSASDTTVSLSQPTLSKGMNTISSNTNVQPSAVYIRGTVTNE